MKHSKYTITTFLRLTLVVTALMVLTPNCKKTTVVENPFTNITTLDCRNLIIRNVELKDTSALGDTAVEVTIENTCKNCKNDNLVYLGLRMLDRQTEDTLAWICETCLSCPRNGEVKKYQLYTSLKNLPDIHSVEFDFIGLCNDLTYLPK